MTNEEFDTLIERHGGYGFYASDNVGSIVCTKLPTVKKYFLDSDGCSCPGFNSHRKCKHVGMLNGVWTPDHGTPDWFESEFGDIFPDIKLPVAFNTAFVVVDVMPYNYELLCFTIEYDKYKMGVSVSRKGFDYSSFQDILFDG